MYEVINLAPLYSHKIANYRYEIIGIKRMVPLSDKKCINQKSIFLDNFTISKKVYSHIFYENVSII